MRYHELREAVDISFITTSIRKIIGEQIKDFLNNCKYFGPDLANSQEWGYFLSDKRFLTDDNIIRYYYNPIVKKLNNIINEYLLQRYGKIKPIALEFSYVEVGEYDLSHLAAYASIEQGQYVINLNTVINFIRNIIRRLAIDLYVNNANVDERQINKITNQVFNFSSFVHELEHIEQFIKTKDKSFYTSMGHRTSLDKMLDITLDRLLELSRTPSGGDLNEFLYFSSNEELDAFTTQAVNIITSNYSPIQIRRLIKDTPKFLLDLVRDNIYVTKIMNSIDQYYEDLDKEYKTPKLEKEIEKLKQYIYKTVIKKLFNEMDKIEKESESPIQEFTRLTNTTAIETIGKKIYRQFINQDVETLDKIMVSDKLENIVNGYNINYAIEDAINALYKLPENLQNKEIVVNRINNYKRKIKSILLNKVMDYKRKYYEIQ